MTRVTRRPEPRRRPLWQRGLALLVVIASLAAAAAVLAGTDVGDRTSWAKHVTGAAVAILVPGGIALTLLVPKAGVRLYAYLGWLGPVALAWLGLEHWLNWFAFYNPSRGKGRVTSEGDARFQGALAVALGVFLACVWGYLVREERRQRRRAGRAG